MAYPLWLISFSVGGYDAVFDKSFLKSVGAEIHISKDSISQNLISGT